MQTAQDDDLWARRVFPFFPVAPGTSGEVGWTRVQAHSSGACQRAFQERGSAQAPSLLIGNLYRLPGSFARTKPQMPSPLVLVPYAPGKVLAAGAYCTFKGNGRLCDTVRTRRLPPHRDSQGLHFSIEVAALESQSFGRARNVALILLEFAEDVVAFVGGSRLLQ